VRWVVGAAGVVVVAVATALQKRVAKDYRAPLRLVPVGLAQVVGGLGVLAALFSARVPGDARVVGVGVVGAVAVFGGYDAARGVGNARLASLMSRRPPRLPAGASLPPPGKLPPAPSSTRPRRAPAAAPPPRFAPTIVDAAAAAARPLAQVGLLDAIRSITSRPWRPRPLLFLWVFETEPNVLLLNAARGLGPVTHLCGGGTLASRGVLAAAFGDPYDQVEETPEEVLARLATFTLLRPFGYYRVNRILCTDATWTFALDRLLERSTAVVMDLTTFADEREGCAYELGVLIDRIDLGRVLLVTGPHTDDGLLDRTLREAWATMATDSPNRRPDAHPLVVARTTDFEHAITDTRSDSARRRKKVQSAEALGLVELLKQAAERAPLPPPLPPPARR
jgi:hypothetical protein